MEGANLGATWIWGFKTYKGENKKSFCQGCNVMTYHHFQKKLNFHRNTKSYLCFYRKLFWERRKMRTVNILAITEVPVLCTQEIQLNRTMDERIEAFISIYILVLKKLTDSLSRVLYYFHSFIINISICEIYSPRCTQNSSWWLFLGNGIVGSEMVENFHLLICRIQYYLLFFLHVSYSVKCMSLSFENHK